MKFVFLSNRQKMGVFYSPFINHSQEMIIVVILVTSTFAIGSYFREIPLDVIWEPDDAIHISVASSFRESKNFAG